MLTNNCRLCNSTRINLAIDLGHHPLADTFPQRAALNEPETRYPLRTLLCDDCGHMMLQFVVTPEERYQKTDYSYTSSNSPVAIKHFAEMAQEIIQIAKVSSDDLVVDIGSSDGTLLNEFKNQSGCKIIGIEPAANIATIANEAGVPTLNKFFDKSTATKILEQKKAKAITANNVFNHITDLSDFMSNVCDVLTDDGYFVFETPSLLHLVDRLAFDTIYLEHVSYFGIKPLKRFFKQFGLSIHRVDLNDYMGGSMRVYINKSTANEHIAEEMIKKEEAAGIYTLETYARFMKSIKDFKMKLCRELYDIKASGGKIIGIGAATKGNTLLNYCNIDATLLECVTDSSPLKIGKYTPGSHLPIISDADIPKDATHALILPWNIGNFLKEKLKHLPLKFLIPQMKKKL